MQNDDSWEFILFADFTHQAETNKQKQQMNFAMNTLSSLTFITSSASEVNMMVKINVCIGIIAVKWLTTKSDTTK